MQVRCRHCKTRFGRAGEFFKIYWLCASSLFTGDYLEFLEPIFSFLVRVLLRRFFFLVEKNGGTEAFRAK